MVAGKGVQVSYVVGKKKTKERVNIDVVPSRWNESAEVDAGN